MFIVVIIVSGMGRASTGTTPLAVYLRDHELTQRAFIEKLTAARGYPVLQSQISAWVTGEKVPNRATQRDIQTATENAVTIASWRPLERKRAKTRGASAPRRPRRASTRPSIRHRAANSDT